MGQFAVVLAVLLNIGLLYVSHEIVERNLNRVIATAPFLYAPSREPLDLGKLNDGGAVELNWERQSYGLRIFGALPEELPPGDCRVFLQLEQNGTALTFEAFPIYETELLGEEGTNGFSAFLPSEPELSGTWTVHVVTENTVFHTTKKDILGAPSVRKVPQGGSCI